MRNTKTREGYDYWDKLCSIPRYGFVHSPDNSRVLKVEGIGNWIDRDEAQVIMDEAQEEINILRDHVKKLRLALADAEDLMPTNKMVNGEYQPSA